MSGEHKFEKGQPVVFQPAGCAPFRATIETCHPRGIYFIKREDGWLQFAYERELASEVSEQDLAEG